MADLEDVARIILGGIAGAITGAMVALAVCSLPGFFLPGQEAGVLGFVALFWLAPAGIIVGAIAGGFATKRFGLARCALAMLLSIVLGPWVASAAEDHAMPPLVSASGCHVNPREITSLMSGTVTITEWSCPGRDGRQLHLSIAVDGAPTDVKAPGNVLVLDASTDLPNHPLLVFVTDDSSGFTVAYDHRARVISQHARVGARPVRFVEHLADAPTPPPTSAVDTATDAPAAPPVPACTNVAREQGMSPDWTVRIFTRTCAGHPPTIDVAVAARPSEIDPDAPGNALSLDASAEVPGDSFLVRIARTGASSLTFGYDRRAPLLRHATHAGSIRIHAIVESDSALRRGSFDQRPSGTGAGHTPRP